MWIALVTSTVLCIFAYYVWSLKRPKPKNTYWIDRGVKVFPPGAIPSLSERVQLKVPFHEFDLKIYQAMKSLGQDFIGEGDKRTRLLFLSDLELIKSIMVKDFDYWVNRRTIDIQRSDPIFNNMLPQTKGDYWKDLRSILTPTFTTGKIRSMYSIFQESSKKLENFILSEIQSNSSNELEVTDCFTRFTTDVISSVAFGLDSRIFHDNSSEFWTMIQKLQNRFSKWASIKFLLFSKFPKLYQFLGIPLMDSTATKYFSDTIKNTIQHRLKTGARKNDFLQLLIDASEEEQKNGNKFKLSQELILSQCISFFISGFDTFKTVPLFAAYELAVNPEVQEKLYQEVEGGLNGDGALDYEVLIKMEYLDHVVSETLRRYPPVIRTERVNNKEYQLPNSTILEKDTPVAILIYGIHHDEDYYPDPFKFDPERFTPEAKNNRHPFTYMPFGMGPRNCIANRFALIEAKSLIAHLVLKFKLEPCSKTHVPMKYGSQGTLKPEGGMWLQIKPRL